MSENAKSISFLPTEIISKDTFIRNQVLKVVEFMYSSDSRYRIKGLPLPEIYYRPFS